MRVVRGVAMWLCQDYTGSTQPEITRIFGGLHYSAVAQAVRRVRSNVHPITAYMGLWGQYGRSREFVVAAPAETTISG